MGLREKYAKEKETAEFVFHSFLRVHMYSMHRAVIGPNDRSRYEHSKRTLGSLIQRGPADLILNPRQIAGNGRLKNHIWKKNSLSTQKTEV